MREEEQEMAHIVAAGVAVGGLPKLDVLAGEGLDLARRVDDAGSGRARPDIYADIMVLQRHCEYDCWLGW
jgi:hypothetical protein